MQAAAAETGSASLTAEARRHNSAMPAWVPLLLSVPAWIPLAVTATRAGLQGKVPTAFVQYDLAAYLANARQHFTQGFHLAYANPYGSYGTPHIYFEPHLLLLGFLQWLGLSPDAALILFGLAAVAFTSITAGKLYEHWVGWRTQAQKLGFVCFFWGGGLMSLGGALFGLVTHGNLVRSFFVFDPSDGWWMLNFGRNLVAPTEAYYHGLFLLAILLLLRRQFGWTLAVAALLSASHPFTGISLALVLAGYSALELGLKSGAASWKLLAGSITVAALHVGYYLVFLSRFADHRALEWSLDWPYLPWTYVPALYLVGVLALGRLTRWKNVKTLLADARMRLALVWFIVIFGLTQHDQVISPRQPIHFAHGYDWMALFFLATPALLTVLEKMLAISRAPLRALALAGFLAIFLSDNVMWFASFADPNVQWHAITLTREEKDVLDWLHGHAEERSYVASTDLWINYLTPTYTNVKGWSGHDYNTPHGKQKKREVAAAFDGAQPIPTDHAVYYVAGRNRHWTPFEGAEAVYANPAFEVWLFHSQLIK
jgi:hypothetical protein